MSSETKSELLFNKIKNSEPMSLNIVSDKQPIKTVCYTDKYLTKLEKTNVSTFSITLNDVINRILYATTFFKYKSYRQFRSIKNPAFKRIRSLIYKMDIKPIEIERKRLLSKQRYLKEQLEEVNNKIKIMKKYYDF